jgi:hypothetical protein
VVVRQTVVIQFLQLLPLLAEVLVEVMLMQQQVTQVVVAAAVPQLLDKAVLVLYPQFKEILAESGLLQIKAAVTLERVVVVVLEHEEAIPVMMRLRIVQELVVRVWHHLSLALVSQGLLVALVLLIMHTKHQMDLVVEHLVLVEQLHLELVL